MIFWIFVILTVLCIEVIAGTWKITEKHSRKEDENTRFVNFVYSNDKHILSASIVVLVISGIVAIIMFFVIIVNQATADGTRSSKEQQYKAFIYKVQAESIHDKFGTVSKECIDEVMLWNEDVAKHQAYSRNFWIGIFYPKRAYDGLETINLEDIKMRD